MGIKSAEEIAKFKERLKESALHTIIHIVIWSIFVYSFMTILNKNIVYIALGLLSLVLFSYMLTRNATGQTLIIHSWIRLVFITIWGVALGRFIYILIILPMLIIITIYDVFSFTRWGKNTLNAKTINNKELLPRFLVFGRSFKTGKPVPTKGYGDYLWYSIAFSSIFTTYGKSIGLLAIIAIIVGVIINLIIISRIYRYSWFKGFPATVGPLGLCVILIIIKLIVNIN